MEERAHGLILRTHPLTETSTIVNWLTPDLGRIATVAKGARRPKSPFRGKLDLFYEGDFSFARSRKSELHALREVVLTETNAALRTNLGWIQQASYFSALVDQTTETETPLPHIYDLVKNALRLILSGPPTALSVFAFEIRLLNELGQGPDWEESKLSPGTRQVTQILANGEWSMLGRLKISEAQQRELRQFLHGFMIYHLEKIPRSRTAALDAE
jgi:DNA repair protein RecO (recombination protein O)